MSSPQMELFTASPTLFVENRGQWEESVRFLHQGDGANVAITDRGPVFEIYRKEIDSSSETLPSEFPNGLYNHQTADDSTTEMLQFSASFLGANVVLPTGENAAETKFNYFIGDQSGWRSDVPSFTKVEYAGLYSGIDLHAWGQRDSLKYEFHVAPGADYRQVQVHYAGIEGLSINPDGSLQVNLGGDWGQLTDDAPYIYQVIEGRQVAVEGKFELLDSQTYTFIITGAYDPNQEIVIDPDLAWTDYLGGNKDDYGWAIAADSLGNAFLTGKTLSTSFFGAPNALKGATDAFVAKLSTTGTLAWATYLGGSGGDSGNGISVDASGTAYVAGTTSSSNFPGKNNDPKGSDDAFVAKIGATGILVWATYLGGNSDDSGSSISLDAAGNAFVTGTTFSNDLSGANNSPEGSIDAFAAKITSAGTLAWATYLGGNSEEESYGIAVDTSGNAFITGYTYSRDFAHANNSYQGGGWDAFVAKVSPEGTLAWASYLGGDGNEYGYGIALDASNNALVTGASTSTDFSSVNNSHYGGTWDAFLAKITPAGTLLWASYLGGTGDDRGQGVALNASGNVYLTGYTSSTDFSHDENSPQGENDAFLAKFTSTGSLTSALYVGGSNNDKGHGISVNGLGEIFLVGQTATMYLPEAINGYKGGTSDAFVAKFTDLSEPTIPTWDGGGNDNNWTTPANWSTNTVPLPGSNLIFPTGATRLENTNDFPSNTVFGSITVSGGNYQFLNNPIQANTVDVQNDAVLTATSIICDTLTIGSASASAGHAVQPMAVGQDSATRELESVRFEVDGLALAESMVNSSESGSLLPNTGEAIPPRQEETISEETLSGISIPSTVNQTSEVFSTNRVEPNDIMVSPVAARQTAESPIASSTEASTIQTRDIRQNVSVPYRLGLGPVNFANAQTRNHDNRRDNLHLDTQSDESRALQSTLLEGRDLTTKVAEGISIAESGGDSSHLAAIRSAILNYEQWHAADTLDTDVMQSSRLRESADQFEKAVDAALALI